MAAAALPPPDPGRCPGPGPASSSQASAADPPAPRGQQAEPQAHQHGRRRLGHHDTGEDPDLAIGGPKDQLAADALQRIDRAQGLPQPDRLEQDEPLGIEDRERRLAIERTL